MIQSLWSPVVTGHNGHKLKWPQPKRPQTETATNPKRPQTETVTNPNGHKPEQPQTETATDRNGHKRERPQNKMATSVVTHHISCHQNIYDGGSPIGNDDIPYAGDPIWIKGKEERNEDGARGQCHLKSYQGQGH